MKDKIFFPSVVLTMVFLIVFMLICINTQTSMTKELSGSLERMQAEITKIKQVPIHESIQKESRKLKVEIEAMKNEIIELRKELEKVKSEAASKKRKK